MANLRRLKKRLVRGAVSENVELIEGRPPRSTHPRTVLYRALGRTGPLVLGAGAVFVSSLLIANVSRELPVTVPMPVYAAPPADRPSDLPLVRFQAPAEIDRRVFPLEVKRVILDPGHGGERAGTVAGDLRESDLTLDVAQRVRELLEAEGLEVLMTRERDAHVELADRVRFANDNRGDVFVSIHVNWLVTRLRGVETYYLGPTDDPFLTQLTSEENRDSGYSLTDFRRLLEGLYHEVRQEESRDLAKKVQQALYRSLLRVNPKIVDRGTKTAPFVVLIGTEMPAILAEVSSLSNNEEAELLRKPLYRQYIAEALFRGIVDYTETLTGSPARTLTARAAAAGDVTAGSGAGPGS